MRVVVEKDMESLSREAAQSVAEGILCAFSEHGEARVVFGADAGLMKVSEKLAMVSGIDWSRVALFHFNEYVRLPASHTASVRNRLRSQFVDKLPAPLRGFNEINGGARDLGRERRRLKRLIDAATVDVACVGIGINGSLAFNEPPADFETVEAYAVVRLSAECRSRLTVQGWFDSEKDAPKHAVCMTVPQIMRCRKIVCVCEGAQRAASVHNLLRGRSQTFAPRRFFRSIRIALSFWTPIAPVFSGGGSEVACEHGKTRKRMGKGLLRLQIGALRENLWVTVD